MSDLQSGPVMSPANAFYSRLRGDMLGTAWFKSYKILKSWRDLSLINKINKVFISRL